MGTGKANTTQLFTGNSSKMRTRLRERLKGKAVKGKAQRLKGKAQRHKGTEAQRGGIAGGTNYLISIMLSKKTKKSLRLKRNHDALAVEFLTLNFEF